MNSHCIYGCKTDGTPCQRPHTCHTLGPKLAAQRAIDEQAKTDRKAANDHADDTGDIGENVLDGIAAALIVWLVACVFAPALAGYLSHMKG